MVLRVTGVVQGGEGVAGEGAEVVRVVVQGRGLVQVELREAATEVGRSEMRGLVTQGGVGMRGGQRERMETVA